MSDYNIADDIIYHDDSMENWPVFVQHGKGVSQEDWDKMFPKTGDHVLELVKSQGVGKKIYRLKKKKGI